jgi:hypothetical protein
MKKNESNKNKLNLKEFNFEKITNLGAFAQPSTNKELLQEAKDRGFYNGYTKYNKLFSKLFFTGGKVEFKKDIDEHFREIAWMYCRSFMQSFSPKHEEKEAICAMIMSEILEVE